MANIRSYEFNVLADYFQFYLEDGAKPDKDNPGGMWTDQTVADLLAVGGGFIAIGTVRNMTVPVYLDVLDGTPDDAYLQRLYDMADHVTQASVEVSSGRIVVIGCTEYYPDAPRIPVKPGGYQARIFYNQLDTLSENGLDGDDNYRIVLWPGQRIEPKVLKRMHIL